MEHADVQALRDSLGGLEALRRRQPQRMANVALKFLRHQCTYADGQSACALDLTATDVLVMPLWLPDAKGPGGRWSETDKFEWRWRWWIASLNDELVGQLFGLDTPAPAGESHAIEQIVFSEIAGLKDRLPSAQGNKWDFVLRQRGISGVTPKVWHCHPNSRGKMHMTSATVAERITAVDSVGPGIGARQRAAYLRQRAKAKSGPRPQWVFPPNAKNPLYGGAGCSERPDPEHAAHILAAISLDDDDADVGAGPAPAGAIAAQEAGTSAVAEGMLCKSLLRSTRTRPFCKKTDVLEDVRIRKTDVLKDVRFEK